jgi:hypothetical protein
LGLEVAEQQKHIHLLIQLQQRGRHGVLQSRSPGAFDTVGGDSSNRTAGALLLQLSDDGSPRLRVSVTRPHRSGLVRAKGRLRPESYGDSPTPLVRAKGRQRPESYGDSPKQVAIG